MPASTPTAGTARVRRLAPFSLLPLLPLLLLALPAGAGAKELGVFKDWTAHQLDSDSGTICFMESRPKTLDAKPADRKAETTRVTVTHRPKKGVFYALLFETGFPLDDKVLADIAIDGNVYKMGTDAGGYFYLSEIKDELALLDAMKGGSKLVAKGTMPDGTPVSDSYSLSGFTAAMKAIDEACPK